MFPLGRPQVFSQVIKDTLSKKQKQKNTLSGREASCSIIHLAQYQEKHYPKY